jgi:hypothetical protein
MIRLRDTSELFRTINSVADGKGDYPENKINPVEFRVIGKDSFDHRIANSMWAATEWLKNNNINPHDVVWLN